MLNLGQRAPYQDLCGQRLIQTVNFYHMWQVPIKVRSSSTGCSMYFLRAVQHCVIENVCFIHRLGCLELVTPAFPP